MSTGSTNNTPYPDGSRARLDSALLSQMGFTVLTPPAGEEITEEELLLDYFKLREVLHKYKICHKDDLVKHDERIRNMLKCCDNEYDVEVISEYFCEALNTDGTKCPRKGDFDGFCKVHSRNK